MYPQGKASQSCKYRLVTQKEHSKAKRNALGKTAAGKTRAREILSSRFIAGIKAIGNSDEGIGELVSSGVSPAALPLKMAVRDTLRKNLGTTKDKRVALNRKENANEREQNLQDDTRMKAKAALLRMVNTHGGNQ